jgi:serine/threonine protein kinase
MEYVEGPTLLEKLTHPDPHGNIVPGRPYPVEDVLRWGIQLCDVLIYLADQNPPVVHHDIKPANIIIDRASGNARLVDFGTAKARLVLQPGGRMGIQQSSIYGTEGYAAPEMYQGESSPAPTSTPWPPPSTTCSPTTTRPAIPSPSRNWTRWTRRCGPSCGARSRRTPRPAPTRKGSKRP